MNQKIAQMMKSSLLALLAMATFSSVFAPRALAVEEILKTYRSARSLGMGGVMYTTGLYDEALFANPATQMQATKSKISPLNLTVEGNTHVLSDYSDVSKVRSASGSDIIATIGDKHLAGRNEHIRFTLLVPGLYWPKLFNETTGMSFALIVNSQTNIMLRSNTDVEYQALVDAGPAFGFGHKFTDLGLDVGLNLRVLYRLGADRRLTAADLLGGEKLSFSSIGGQGIGLDADLGAYYILPFHSNFFEQLSVGVSGNNLLQSTYRLAGNNLISSINTPPSNNDRTLNVGARTNLPDVWILRDSLFSIEMQDIGRTHRLASAAKKLHIGGETHLSKVFTVRAGFNQGYITGGVGVDLPIVKMDLATYGEELGANTGQSEDRRVVFQLGFEI